MLKNLLEKLIARQQLSLNEIEFAIQTMSMADETQLAAMLVLLRSKEETPEEISGFIQSLQRHSHRIHLPFPVLDIVGTGGDNAQTLNISTGAAILAAACGVPVAKHGNRAVSSRSGSADVLESLGIQIDLQPKQAEQCISKIGLGFLFAPYFHSFFKQIRPLRLKLKVPTIFNLIAPLLNPAKAEYLVFGLFDPKNVNKMAQALKTTGIKKGIVFHGNGTDELLPGKPIQTLLVSEGEIKPFLIEPHRYGLNSCTIGDLRGGDPSENAERLIETLSGQAGPFAQTLALNAGIGIWLYGQAESPEEGVQIAQTILKSGRALELLHQWKLLTIALARETNG